MRKKDLLVENERLAHELIAANNYKNFYKDLCDSYQTMCTNYRETLNSAKADIKAMLCNDNTYLCEFCAVKDNSCLSQIGECKDLAAWRGSKKESE